MSATAAVASATPVATTSVVSAREVRAIAKDAYVYAFPMLENYRTLYRQAVDTTSEAYVGGFNRYRHYSEPFGPDNTDIVTPNNDTPYSWAWLDLRGEPFVVSVPAVPDDRYYVMQWVDLFTQIFAYIGVRATGFEDGDYLICGPHWRGATPEGVRRVFRAETELVGTLTRTSLAGPGDVDTLRALQAQYRLTPLSAWCNRPAPPPAPGIAFPPYDEKRARSHDFIGYLNFLLQFAKPPHPSETALRRRFERIGIGPGWEWNASKVDPRLLEAIDQGAADGQAAIAAAAAETQGSNGLFGSRAFLGADYLKRAAGAALGIYGNAIEEAWYGGYVADGSEMRTLRFTRATIPPAKFFWSMTLYRLPERLLYANRLHRYSIGDRTQGLVYGADNSLTLYIGHESPGPELEPNWLPAPDGPYSLVLRVYGPNRAATNGEWSMPELRAMVPA